MTPAQKNRKYYLDKLFSHTGAKTPQNAARVKRLLRQLHAAPGRLSDEQEYEARQTARKLLNEAADTQGRNFWQKPTKAELTDRMKDWTTSQYRNVQALRRGQAVENRSVDHLKKSFGIKTANGRNVSYYTDSFDAQVAAARRLDRSMDMYMQRFSLRAPQMPPKVRNVARPSSEFPVLWRGMSVTKEEFDAYVRGGKIIENGYIAFSRKRHYALNFGTRKGKGVNVLIRLDVRDVPRGTPWIWFVGEEQEGGMYHKNWTQGVAATEAEVLLPPGTLHVRKVTKGPDANTLDVSFRRSDTPWTVARAAGKFIASRQRRLARALPDRRPLAENMALRSGARKRWPDSAKLSDRAQQGSTTSTLYDRTLAEYMALRSSGARFAARGTPWGRAVASAQSGRLAQLHRTLMAMKPPGRRDPPPPTTRALPDRAQKRPLAENMVLRSGRRVARPS